MKTASAHMAKHRPTYCPAAVAGGEAWEGGAEGLVGTLWQ